MFLHVWKAIDNTIILALSYFQYIFLLLTDEYLPHTVFDWKGIDPQATTSSYLFGNSRWGELWEFVNLVYCQSLVIAR